MRVLFGSQTGNAQEVAEKISRSLERRNFAPVYISSLDDFSFEGLCNEQLVLFVVATTGDGDPPDNMKTFWRNILRKGLSKDSLQNLNFSVFGLGDSSYANFNVIARKLRNRLIQLGASEVALRGLGDDQSANGLEGDLDGWLLKEFWPKMFEKYPLPEGFVIDDSPCLVPPKVNELHLNDEPCDSKFVNIPVLGCYVDGDGNSTFTAKVHTNERITASDWEQDVRHLEFVTDNGPPYRAGDIAIVYPRNVIDEHKLAMFASRIGIPNLNSSIHSAELSNLCIPGSLSARELLTRYLDICGTPRRSFFEQLSFFSSDEEEKEKLLELASPDGNDLYHTYCKKERKSYMEVFEDFKSVRVPLEYFVGLIPRLQPRQYSISSCRQIHGNQMIHLTVALLEYTTPWGRKKRGVASEFFKDLSKGTFLDMAVKPGTLCSPKENAPMVLIGPGTGIAPMRALAYEQKSMNRTELYIYFGCRKASKDFYYREDWEQLLQEGSIKNLRAAFSRDGPKKIYVQKLLKEDKALLWNLLVERNGYCFICGSAARMPTEVRDAIIDALHDCMTEGETRQVVEQFIKKMQQEGRFKIESWS